MTWVILSLNILTGDFTLNGQFTKQEYCITALKTARSNEFQSHIRQCVQIENSYLDDYKRDKHDWKILYESRE
jgi:hypothetical protein